MKSVTEFANHVLTQGLKVRTEMTGEGKTAEEIQAKLGEAFKYEGDKLKHFVAAVEVAGQNLENLSRVLVVSLNEGENAPPKAIKVEEHHYYPEFKMAPKAVVMQKNDPKGGGKRKDGPKGPKESPWGLTPEQKAAKKAGAAKPTKPA